VDLLRRVQGQDEQEELWDLVAAGFLRGLTNGGSDGTVTEKNCVMLHGDGKVRMTGR
jgi:hypothetical protein